MEKEQKKPTNVFGLIGKGISYSFSRSYFTEKFKTLQLYDHSYVNFDIPSIAAVPFILKNNPNLRGLNVTIPYKEAIIPYLNELSEDARNIGAVNTIKCLKNNHLIGYNTDHYGFRKSFSEVWQPHHKKALILGSGGAAKAVVYALNTMGIPYRFVSRRLEGSLRYTDLDKSIMETHNIIINCTPLGTAPNLETKPDIPYRYIGSEHLLYDLVYNPKETTFLKLGKQHGATLCNGMAMLKFQAERAWTLWNG